MLCSLLGRTIKQAGHSRFDGHIMIQHSGARLLAIEVEVGMLSQVDRGGSSGTGLHADA